MRGKTACHMERRRLCYMKSNDSTQRSDLVEVFSHMLGCEFISDLHAPSCHTQLERALENICPEDYTIWAWNDAVKYITGVGRAFQTQHEAYQCLSLFCAQAQADLVHW